MNVPLVTLDGVTDLLTDGTHYTPKDRGEGVPFLTVKDLSEDGLDFIGCSRIDAAEFENAKKQNSAPRQGDILFSKDGTVGKVHLVREDQPFAVLSSLAILRPSAKIDGAYLAHFLRTPSTIEAAGNKKTGSAIRRIVLRDLATLELPLPPLDEQRRIAAILDEADALCRKRKRALGLADQLARSIFNSHHQGSRKSWTEIRFVDLAQQGSGNFGNGPFGSDLLTSELTAEGVPVVYIRDIVTEKYKRVSQSFVTERKAAQLPACSVKGGDLLITKVGDPPGVATVYPYDEPNAIMTQDVIRLRTNPLMAIPEYLAFLLNSSEGRHLISGITVAATRARFSLRDLKALKVSIPPLETQHAFVIAIKALHKVSEDQVASEATIDSLFSSLQSRAFSSQL